MTLADPLRAALLALTLTACAPATGPPGKPAPRALPIAPVTKVEPGPEPAKVGPPSWVWEPVDKVCQYALEITMFWNHPSVRGITYWGYVRGTTWRGNAWLVDTNGKDRHDLVAELHEDESVALREGLQDEG